MWAVPLVVGFGLVSRAAALLATEGSPCGTLCGNVLDSTTESDIVCADDDYANEDAGVLYQQCVTCEMTSNYHSANNETDVNAMLCMDPISSRFGDLPSG